MFTIDFTYKVENEFRQGLRTQFNVDIHRWWLTTIQELHTNAYADGLAMYDSAVHTCQIGSLCHYLNNKFGVSGIYITLAEQIDPLVLYTQLDPYETATSYLESEDDPQEVSYLESEQEPVQFIVWVPGILYTDSIIEQINNYVAEQAFAGFTWQVNLID